MIVATSRSEGSDSSIEDSWYQSFAVILIDGEQWAVSHFLYSRIFSASSL